MCCVVAMANATVAVAMWIADQTDGLVANVINGFVAIVVTATMNAKSAIRAKKVRMNRMNLTNRMNKMNRTNMMRLMHLMHLMHLNT
jgi:hypothetical protein